MRDFVNYLNTLHRFNGNNDNATAEANYLNKFASDILVTDKNMVDNVNSALKNKHRVLLTGFAGDGKTTIARIIAGKNLTEPRTVIKQECLSHPLVIIKDLSEMPDNNDSLYNDLINPDIDLLIVSNTGTFRKRFLDLYDKFASLNGSLGNVLNFETLVLSGMENVDQNAKGSIKICPELEICVFNLVKYDNIQLAMDIFKKILDHNSWNTATDAEKKSIPFINRELLRYNNYQALNRIEMIYRRIYEYGNRMTIRQLIEHFSYSLTGNHCSYHNYTFSNFKDLFFMNFFNPKASHIGMTGVQLVNDSKFGYNIDSNWKRRIWIGSDSNVLKIDLGIKWFEDLFNIEKNHAATKRNEYSCRLSILRALFFMNTAFDDSNYSWAFLSSFLNSPGYRYFNQINKEGGVLPRSDKNHISKKIRHVVKEYFIGMKIPETSSYASQKEVYIAMSRNLSSLKQTTQVILTSFEWKDLIVVKDSRGIYQLVLVTNIPNVSMPISLPFLDYLLSCHSGFITDPAFANYRKRLDNLRNSILKTSKTNDNSLMQLAYMDLSRDIHVINCYNEHNKIYVEAGE